LSERLAYDEVLRVLTDTSALDAEARAVSEEREVVTELNRKYIQENATVPLNQDEYNSRFDALRRRYEAATARLAEIEAQRTERAAKRAEITRFLKTLVHSGDDLLTEFDEELWYITADSITIQADGRLAVQFRDGAEVTIEAEVWRAA